MSARLRASLVSVILFVAACGSGGTAAQLGQTAGPGAGVACNPQYNGQSCSGAIRLQCTAGTVAGTGTWTQVAQCAPGEACVASNDPANGPGQYKQVTVCSASSGADVSAGGDTGGTGADATGDPLGDTGSSTQQDGAPGGQDAEVPLDISIVGGPDAGATGGDTGGPGGKDVGGTGGGGKDGGGPSTGNWCDQNCGNKAPSGCYCDDQCVKYGDCCLADGSKPTSANKSCSGSTCNLCNGSSGPPAPVCGDGTCDANETPQTCAKDCGTGPTTGNWCDANCGQQAPSGCYCDGQCAKYGDCCLPDGAKPKAANNTCAGSTCAMCNGSGTTSGPKCGNGQCEAGETPTSCPADCTNAGPVCGNGKCEAGETAQSCAKDCGSSTGTCASWTDVGPILKSKCGACHGFGNSCSSASVSALGIQNAVSGGAMPPGSKPQLTSAEKAKLSAWVSAGASCSAGCQ